MFASTQDFIMISVIKKHYAGKSLLSRVLIIREENPEVFFLFPSFRRTLQTPVYLLKNMQLMEETMEIGRILKNSRMNYYHAIYWNLRLDFVT